MDQTRSLRIGTYYCLRRLLLQQILLEDQFSVHLTHPDPVLNQQAGQGLSRQQADWGGRRA